MAVPVFFNNAIVMYYINTKGYLFFFCKTCFSKFFSKTNSYSFTYLNNMSKLQFHGNTIK